MIRVGVLGAGGRMGRLVCKTVAEEADLTLVAAIDPSAADEDVGRLVGDQALDVRVSDDPSALLQAHADVAVDFTTPQAVMANIKWAVEHGVHLVVGTTGIGPPDLEQIRRWLEGGGRRSNVVVVPNFAIGAVLLQRFAAEAARFFPRAEIVELHHEGKLDAPSGTALATAQRMAESRENASGGPANESLHGVRGGDVSGIRVHSVRLPGLVAHQEVIFGGVGQTLSLRHDSLARESFMPGVLLAVRSIAGRPGLTVGLEPLLGLPG